MVEGGVGSVTMTAACERSGVTGRYFYDHFADRDALVAAAFEESVQQTMQSVVGAITAARRESCDPARAAITSFVSAFERDPRLARITVRQPATISTVPASVASVGCSPKTRMPMATAVTVLASDHPRKRVSGP